MKKIGIICGGGTYPSLVFKACKSKNIHHCLIFIESESSFENFPVKDTPYISIKLGEIGKGLNFLKSQEVDTVVLAGHVARPNFSSLSLDETGMSWLLRLGMAVFSGDDALLKRLSELFLEENLKIISGTDFLDDVFLNVGIATKIHPSKQDEIDINRGIEVGLICGASDVGQSVIVNNGIVLGIECIEGTDKLIERCAALKNEETPSGVLIKISKPLQLEKIDLPTIGVDTIENIKKGNFRGIAVESGRCIVLEKEKVIALADELGLFLIGISVKD